MPLLTEKLGPACKPCGESHIVCSVDCVARNIDRHKFEVAHADGIEAFTRDVTERTNRKTAALGQMLWRALIPCSSTFDPASDSGTHVMTAPLEEVLRLDRVTLEQADMACYKISERHNRSCYGIRNKLIAARALLAHGLIKKGVSKALGRPDLDAEAAITPISKSSCRSLMKCCGLRYPTPAPLSIAACPIASWMAGATDGTSSATASSSAQLARWVLVNASPWQCWNHRSPSK